MKRYSLQLAMTIVIVAVISGCASPESTSETATYTPEPLPETLASLPRQAKIACRNDPVLDRGKVSIWSLPGTYLADPDSGVNGYRGDQIAAMEPCQPIQLTDFYWDSYEVEYWVKIQNTDFYWAPQEGKFWVKIEANDLEGWIPFELITPD